MSGAAGSEMPPTSAAENGHGRSPSRRGLPLHAQILTGLVVGSAAGIGLNLAAANDPALKAQLEWWAGEVCQPLGSVFLRLIFMIVLPLVFSALVLGMVEIGDVRRLGRVGLRTLAFTLLFSSAAVGLGIGLVNFFKPGDFLSPEQQEALRQRYQAEAQSAEEKSRLAKPLKQTLLDLIPENPLQEMTGALDGSSKGNGMLAVMVFSLLVGIAITQTPERCRGLVQFLEGWNAVAMTIIGWAMALAPYAVACLIFAMTARLGLDIIPPLAGFVGTVVLGLSLQMFAVYGAALLLFGRVPIGFFFRGITEAVLTAFGTSSSNATLPTAIRVATERLRLQPEVARFVLTIGATGNQNGTALYEGVVILFLAQVFHVELTLVQQLQVVLMSVLAGVGTAGVPGGSIPLIVVVMTSVGVPAQGIAIIMGIDRLLDMLRTVLNVTGDLVITACVAEPVEPT